MKIALSLGMLLALTGTASAHCVFCNPNTEQVSGYTRSNGTYVQGYQRTMPDNNPYNNYSTPNYQSGYTQPVQTFQPAYGTQSHRGLYGY